MQDNGYKTAYLHLFNRITDLIESLERQGKDPETAAALKKIQQQAEEDFIGCYDAQNGWIGIM